MTKAPSLNRQRQQQSPEERTEQEESLEIRKKIEKHLGDSRSLLFHRLLSSVTRHSYVDMFDEIREKQQLEWAESTAGFLEKTISKAETEERHMHDMLERGKGLRFSEKDMAELQSWFQDDSLPEMTRSKLLDGKIAEFIAKFDAMAKRRMNILTGMEDVSDQDARDLAVLRSNDAFLRLSTQERNALMDRVETLDIATIKGKHALLADTRALLESASEGEDRYVSPTETGTMLRQMMAADKPEQHHKETLLPSLRAHKDTRVSFDSLVTELSGMDEAPIAAPTLDAFVKWSAGKRTSFIAEGRRRIAAIRSDEEAEANELAGTKARAETLIRRGEWEEAESLLQSATTAFPQDAGLATMEAYLHEHREDTDEEKEEQELDRATAEIDAILTTVHPELRTLYVAMILEGADTFQRFAEGMRRGAVEKRRSQGSAETEAPVVADSREKEDDDEGDDVEIKEDDSTEEQLEIATEMAGAQERDRVLTVAGLSADTQEQYGREINLRVEAKLRQLEEGGRKYQKAA